MTISYIVDHDGTVINSSVSNFPYDYVEEKTKSEIIMELERVVLGIKGLKPDKCMGVNVSSKHSFMIGI